MNRDVLILGGGIAGIQSALLLAEKGHRVHVMDSAPAIGGFFPLLERTFPTNSCGICFMSPRPPAYCPIYENAFHENINVLTHCEIRSLSGRPGDLTAVYEEKPRYVDPARCNLCLRCTEVCPVEVDRELGGGLEKRKAVHLPFMQAIPRSCVIDRDSCTDCGRCLEVCEPGAIDFGQRARAAELRVGAVILGFGFEPMSAAARGEYGFGRYANVFSSVQYERLLSRSGPTGGLPVRRSDGGRIRRLAFIQCVGSRDISCGSGYCSSVCCRIATKQAMISRSRDGELDVAVFYMDIRAMGKEYEKYYERSRREYGIRYVRSAVSSLRELKSSGKLLVTYGSDTGELAGEEFDAVVLSLGFAPPAGARAAAERLGVRLNEHGFCLTREFHPTETTVPGIFVAGAFREPRDIPESVVDACSAAADVSALLEGVAPAPAVRDASAAADGAGAAGGAEEDAEEEPRVGIFVCDKHNLIKQQLDLIGLLGELSLDPGIARVKRVDFSVMTEGLQEVKSLIEEHALNRVIIAGYRCLEIGKFIREHTGVLGARPALVSLANIGEQCANVHLEEREEATRKAYALIRAAIEKLRFEAPGRKGRKALNPRVLVVGGGVAGLSACLSLAAQGTEVTLVEKEAVLGGNARLIHYTLRSLDSGAEDPVRTLVEELVERVEKHPRIETLKGAELCRMDGSWGAFTSVVAVGGETAAGAGEKVVEHGAAIFAVGGREIPPDGYLYGEHPAVLTQRELEQRIVEAEGEAKRLRTVAMVQCVNCRNDRHPYCSRVCCIHAVKNALKLKELNPGMGIFVFYRDVRTYGFYEPYYRRAREQGVVFIRYEEEEPPRVRAVDGRLQVSLRERIIGDTVTVEPDLLALSNGIEPYQNTRLAEIAGLATTPEGFFAEANPKSAPLDSIGRGKFFCGICHSPNLLENVISQGKAAAARAVVLLSGGEGGFSDTPVTVSERLCSGCGLCVSACPYGARAVDPVRNKAVVRPDLCKGCGTCAAACPNGASRQVNFGRKAVLREMDRLLV